MGLLLGYCVSCIVGILLLTYFSGILENKPLGLSFLDGFLRVILLTVAFLVLLAFFFLPTYVFGYRKKKIYRGIGFYRFINTITWLCPFCFFAIVFLWNKLQVSYSFFGLACLFFECALPFAARWVWYHKFMGVRRCPACGLINTMRLGSVNEKKLETRYEFYEYATKGYVYQKTGKMTELCCSICGGKDRDYEEYEKQI